MKILVINEPFVPDFCRTQRWAARTRGRVLRAPDWLAYAASVLERDGFDVELYDFCALRWEKGKIASLANEKKPDFVILDSTTPSIYSDIECAKIIKDNSNARVIMVGPHVSALPDEVLRDARGAVDAACIGEYDYTVRDAVRNFDNLERVPGIAWFNRGLIKKTSPRPLIENLDEIPFPAWHHLDLMKYFDGGKLYPYIDVISGRGCPNRCSFCLWPQVMHGFKYRLRSPCNVVDELEYDIKLCPRVLKGEFFFEDDTFTVDRERAILICEEILKRGLKINFSVNARADSADLEMFKVMKKAGCRELLVGFESGVQQILDNVNKNIKVEDSYRFVELAKKAKLQVHGCFVIGLPGETEETAKKTVDFALSLGCDTLQFSGAVPFPGTKFFELAESSGWLKSRDWAQWLGSGEQKGIISYPGISEDAVNHYVDLGLRKFYFRPMYMLKFLFDTHSVSDLYRKLRGACNFVNYNFEKVVCRRKNC
ncbi:MAG: radical SAM protein [Candidatus Omnitrophota bacterium]